MRKEREGRNRQDFQRECVSSGFSARSIIPDLAGFSDPCKSPHPQRQSSITALFGATLQCESPTLFLACLSSPRRVPLFRGDRGAVRDSDDDVIAGGQSSLFEAAAVSAASAAAHSFSSSCQYQPTIPFQILCTAVRCCSCS